MEYTSVKPWYTIRFTSVLSRHPKGERSDLTVPADIQLLYVDVPHGKVMQDLVLIWNAHGSYMKSFLLQSVTKHHKVDSFYNCTYIVRLKCHVIVLQHLTEWIVYSVIQEVDDLCVIVIFYSIPCIWGALKWVLCWLGFNKYVTKQKETVTNTKPGGVWLHCQQLGGLDFTCIRKWT